MKTRTQNVLLALALISTLNPQLSTFAQGSLTPPGAPAPTMKSLAQIEPRTPIASAPFTINNAGSYYLTTNVTVAVSNAITIAANNVTLDLSGFTIASTAPSPAGAGILISSSRANITILNGFIASGVTEVGGIYGGHGFNSGIEIALDFNNTNTYGQPVNVRVSGVSVSGCLTYGILLGGLSTIVDSCIVQTVGSYGIYAATIKSSVAMDCGNTAINGYQLSDCQGQCIGSATGLYATWSARSCYGYSATGMGMRVIQTAQDCYGYSGGNDYGLVTEIAQNCSGFSATGIGLRATSAINCTANGGSTGLYVDKTAENCFGRANTNGIGLLCYGSANNCYGYCPAGSSGTGLFAYQANNCHGQHDGNGIGLAATVAIGCNGRCYGNNYGISASILNSCIYYRQTGTPGFAGTKYNMP